MRKCEETRRNKNNNELQKIGQHVRAHGAKASLAFARVHRIPR